NGRARALRPARRRPGGGRRRLCHPELHRPAGAAGADPLPRPGSDGDAGGSEPAHLRHHLRRRLRPAGLGVLAGRRLRLARASVAVPLSRSRTTFLLVATEITTSSVWSPVMSPTARAALLPEPGGVAPAIDW